MNISVTIENPPFQKFGTFNLGKRFKLANGMVLKQVFIKLVQNITKKINLETRSAAQYR